MRAIFGDVAQQVVATDLRSVDRGSTPLVSTRKQRLQAVDNVERSMLLARQRLRATVISTDPLGLQRAASFHASLAPADRARDLS